MGDTILSGNLAKGFKKVPFDIGSSMPHNEKASVDAKQDEVCGHHYAKQLLSMPIVALLPT
jgi:hypothetical protein